MRSRSLVVVVALLALVAVAAPVVSSLVTSRREPPPYRWSDGDSAATPIERRLASQKINLRFEATPLREVFTFLQDLTSIPFVVDPAVDEAVRGATATIRLRDVTLETTLRQVLAAAPVPLTFRVDPDKVTIVPATGRPKLGVSHVRAQVQAAWVEDYRRRLSSQKLTLNLTDTPAWEVAALLSDLTGLNVVLAPGASGRTVTLVVRDVLAAEALDAIARASGLRWDLALESIRLTDQPAGGPQGHAPIGLDLRDATVPELVQALEREGVEALPTEVAWLSSGTLALVAEAPPLDALPAAITSWTGLAARWLEPEPGRAVLFIDRALPDPDKALAEPCPPYPAIVAEVSSARAALEAALARRSSARRSAAPDELLRAERAVIEPTLAIRKLLATATYYASVSERRPHLAAAIEAKRAEIGQALAAGSPTLPRLRRELQRLAQELRWLDRETIMTRALEEGATLAGAERAAFAARRVTSAPAPRR